MRQTVIEGSSTTADISVREKCTLCPQAFRLVSVVVHASRARVGVPNVGSADPSGCSEEKLLPALRDVRSR